jgi:coenzyme F420-0:L-glutamate ligase / coenzyme F420-1:gamma-L-glutamate ligase
VDASNVPLGHVVLLPQDPDASARGLRRRLHELTGRVVGVLVTDTAGRAWRDGQTDIAIGAAGLLVLQSYVGRTDAYGNPLAVTAPAVADELAGAAELAQGKLAGRPFAVLRGRADLVLPVDDDGPGAAALLRPEHADLFGYGSREAVLRALTGRPGDRAAFGAPVTADELAEVLGEVLAAVLGPAPGLAPVVDGDEIVVDTADTRAAWLAGVAAYAHGWETVPGDSAVRLRRSPPFT